MRSSLFALFLVACGGAPAVPAAHAVPEIALTELQPLVEAKQVVLIDANGTESYKEGHIPGAIDLAAHPTDLAALLPPQKDALIVAYCGGPSCGAWQKGATAVAALGYTEVKHFAGGISGWKASNAPVETVQ